MSKASTEALVELARALEWARRDRDLFRIERDEARRELEVMGTELVAHRDRLEQAQREIGVLGAELERVRKQKDGAYTERNQLVAALARFAPQLRATACLVQHPADPNWEADWRTIVLFETPAAQLTWHFHDSERALLAGIPAGGEYEWDGHDTPTKYARLAAWAREIEANS